MTDQSVNFRVEGKWTGWGHYTQVPISSFDELKKIMSELDVNIVLARGYPTTGISLVHLKQALIEEHGRKNPFELKLDKHNNQIKLYKHGQMLKDIVLRDRGFHNCFIIPAFKVFAISYTSGINEKITHEFYSIYGNYLDSITGDVYFYQLQ